MATLAGVDRSRAAWWVAALALAVALTFVVWTFVGTFVFGVFIYYATRPVYRRLKDRVRPPSLAATLSLVTLAMPALLLLAYAVAVSLQEFERFSQRADFGWVAERVQPYLDVASIAQNPQAILEEPDAVSILQQFSQEAMSSLGFLGNAGLHLFVMIGIAFYLLRDDRRLGDWFRRRFSDENGVVEAYVRAVDRDFSNIFFGNILNALLTALIGAIVYNLLVFVSPAELTIPYPTLLGLLTGVASLIPVVGMKLVYVPVTGYLLFVSTQVGSRTLWFPAAFAAISFVVVDTIPDFVLRPYVSGRGLHLGMVMFAYIFGPLIWGWYGIFLGPMLLVLIVHFVRLVLPELIAGREIRPTALGTELVTTGDARTPAAGEATGDGDEGDVAATGVVDGETGDEESSLGDQGEDPDVAPGDPSES